MNKSPTILSSCPACLSKKTSGSTRVPDHEYKLEFHATYTTCADCRTLYQTPMPNLHQLSKFYPKKYHSFTKKNALTKIRNKLRLNKLKTYIQPKTIVLDYGCGNGGFLLDAAQAMPDVKFYGYEIASEKHIEKFKNGQVVIIKGPWKEVKDDLPAFHLITMNHVIEHLPDPTTILSDLHNKLYSEGTLQGQTPAADSLEHCIFKKKWSGYHAPRHTVIFTKKGLSHILKRVLFQSQHIKAGFNPAGIAISLASLSHGDRPGSIYRRGLLWILCVAVATVLYPIDLLSGKPGIIDFVAKK